MKYIKLTQGKYTIVDDEDFVELSRYKWQHNAKYASRSINVNGEIIKEYMHRRIMKAPNGQNIDHKNRNRLDNRKENLRFATVSQNKANGVKTRGTSKYKGVCWNKISFRWQAGIVHEGKSFYLGLFKDEERAARAYNVAARQYFGEFANPNTI